MKRNVIIDMLRFFAALAVVFFHFNCYFSHANSWYFKIVGYGWLGVPAFFVISGYCIALSAEKSKTANEYLVRRLFGIFPPYWISVLITFALVIIHKLITGSNRAHMPHNGKEIVETIFLLTHPFSTLEPMNGVYWSLTVEIFFYLVIYLMRLLPTKYFIAFLCIVSIGSLFNKLSLIPGLFFLPFWPAFGIGAGIYFFFKDTGFQKCLSVALVVINIIGLIYSNHPGTNRLFYFNVTSGTALLIILSLYLSLKNNKIAQLGDYSFGVYLLHFPFGVMIFGILKTQIIQKTLFYNISFDIVSYIIILFMAYYFYQFIELPAIDKGKKMAKKYFYK